jgi:hypothetical protein
LGFLVITNGPFIKETVTIEIQIGNLSGSGIIKLSNISAVSEVSELSSLLNPTSFTNQSHLTEAPSLQTTSYPPNTTAAFPYQGTSARNYNTTVFGPTGQLSVGPVLPPLLIFASSESPASTGLLKFPATLFTLIIQIAIILLL